ncbi:DUF2274 domain-containing protein [Bradyrhizobium sp. 160]|nr:DUF2274 domain-containing protein [Bradyrhizobium sp. 160]
MTKLKRGPLEDDKPVKLTVKLPAEVFRCHSACPLGWGVGVQN